MAKTGSKPTAQEMKERKDFFQINPSATWADYQLVFPDFKKNKYYADRKKWGKAKTEPKRQAKTEPKTQGKKSQNTQKQAETPPKMAKTPKKEPKNEFLSEHERLLQELAIPTNREVEAANQSQNDNAPTYLNRESDEDLEADEDILDELGIDESDLIDDELGGDDFDELGGFDDDLDELGGDDFDDLDEIDQDQAASDLVDNIPSSDQILEHFDTKAFVESVQKWIADDCSTRYKERYFTDNDWLVFAADSGDMPDAVKKDLLSDISRQDRKNAYIKLQKYKHYEKKTLVMSELQKQALERIAQKTIVRFFSINTQAKTDVALLGLFFAGAYKDELKEVKKWATPYLKKGFIALLRLFPGFQEGGRPAPNK